MNPMNPWKPWGAVAAQPGPRGAHSVACEVLGRAGGAGSPRVWSPLEAVGPRTGGSGSGLCVLMITGVSGVPVEDEAQDFVRFGSKVGRIALISVVFEVIVGDCEIFREERGRA